MIYVCTIYKKDFKRDLFKDFDYELKLKCYNYNNKKWYSVSIKHDNNHSYCKNNHYVDFDNLYSAITYCKHTIHDLKKQYDIKKIFYNKYI